MQTNEGASPKEEKETDSFHSVFLLSQKADDADSIRQIVLLQESRMRDICN